jgi:3-hydroxyisobutyrate dehydrogenase-like beta-hydroxyacid dehydrogenase
MRLAVIGLGNMGSALASRGLDKDHRVTVWNRSPDRAADLISNGAAEMQSPGAAVADCDVALVVLSDDEAVLGVCLGDHGVLGSLPRDAVLAVVSTVAPDTIHQLISIDTHAQVLDSPVMGSPATVAAGKGSFLIGGPEPTVRRLDALWSDLGSGYTYCGPSGSGATLKIISNLLLITGVAALAEAIATARRHGLSDELLKSVLSDSFVVSPASKVRLDSLFDEQHPGWFAPDLARKDVRLAVGLAESADVGVRIGPATAALLSTVIESGQVWPDFSAVIEALNRR